MRRCILSCLVLAMTAVLALAADKQLMLTNRAGEAVTAVSITATATPDEPLPMNMELPVANGTTTMMTVSLPDSACIFDASYTFTSGQTQKQPDLDICQLDGLVVE
jgi:hypothetical protein